MHGAVVMSGAREDRQICDKCNAEKYNDIVEMKLKGLSWDFSLRYRSEYKAMPLEIIIPGQRKQLM